jgi:hypothetical protein
LIDVTKGDGSSVSELTREVPELKAAIALANRNGPLLNQRSAEDFREIVLVKACVIFKSDHSHDFIRCDC